MFASRISPQPTTLGDFDATPEIETRLNALAWRAKTDPGARAELYDLLELKVRRFVGRYRARQGHLRVCQLDDISQEAFVVFCDIVASWPGEESFLGFFLSRFPWRLARAVDVMERGWSGARLLPLAALGESIPDPDDPIDLFQLAEIGATLSPTARLVLQLHIGHGLRLVEIARVLGIPQRAIYRIWQATAEEVRASWPERRERRPRRAR